MISDEILDELATPGCANCAVKHMSAAVAYTATGPIGLYQIVHDHVLYEARARVNAVEYLEGYASHYDFAVGLMELAEESACAAGLADEAKAIRARRISLMSSASRENVSSFVKSSAIGHIPMAAAHVEEAIRELPTDDRFAEAARKGILLSCRTPRIEAFRECIRHVRELYFPSENEEGKEVNRT